MPEAFAHPYDERAFREWINTPTTYTVYVEYRGIPVVYEPSLDPDLLVGIPADVLNAEPTHVTATEARILYDSFRGRRCGYITTRPAVPGKETGSPAQDGHRETERTDERQ